LLDTGIFDEDRYLDVFVEYIKAGPDDLGIRISVANRGPKDAKVASIADTLAPQYVVAGGRRKQKPSLSGHQMEGVSVISAHHVDPLFKQSFSDSGLYCEEGPDLRFTENENDNAKLFGGQNASPYVKDGINDYVSIRTDKALGTGPNFRLACDSELLAALP
jgi:hypothetical protein